MEQATKTLKEKPNLSVQPTAEGVSNHKGSAEKKEPQMDQKLTSSQTFNKLKRDLNKMVINIHAAAVAREVQWRAEVDKASKLRLELLEDHNQSTKDKLEEISKGWLIAKEKVIPQEVQAALSRQQQLCADLIKDKNKIIDANQQDLKVRDDSFVTDLKKQKEELQLMLERMEEQDKTLTKAYRETLQQWIQNVKKEEETIRNEERMLWEQSMKKLLETEVDKLLKRQQIVEEYDIQSVMFETADRFNTVRNKDVADYQIVELEIHQAESERVFMEQKIKKLKAEVNKLKIEDSQVKAKVSSVQSELRKLWVNEQTNKRRKEKQLKENRLKELNRKAQDYERLEKKLLHFAVADAITFENMLLVVDAEVKELLERALYVDSVIYEQILHLPWERPNLNFAEPGRRQENKRTVSQTSPSSQGRTITSQTEAANVDVVSEGFYNDSGSKEEVASTVKKDEIMSSRTVKRMMELLCDEAGFLIEVKIAKLLDTLDESERTLIKMGYLFNTLGIEEKDVPKLVDFFYEYGQQHYKERELQDDEVSEPSNGTAEGETSSTPDPVDRNDVLHALKCFLDRYKQGSDTKTKWSLQSLEARDLSEDEAYWNSLSNVITADKLRIWEATESSLEQHHAVLSEISELDFEIQSLQQENTELQMVCMLLQQARTDQQLSLNPEVVQLNMD